MSVLFYPIASGSGGNSTLVATGHTHILIDAGLPGKTIENGLSAIGVNPSALDAIFVTHEHGDHVKGVGVLSRRYNVPVFATEKTWREMDKSKSLGDIAPQNRQTVYIWENCTVNDIIVNPFAIPHDCAAPVGYCIFAEDYKLAVATDMGHVTEGIRESLSDCDCLLLESNHDVDMLVNGPYPQHLKRRILSHHGHLSNACCGQLITQIASKRLKHVFLGHLSEENNRPLVAMETVSRILTAGRLLPGKDLHLQVAMPTGNGQALRLP